VGLPVYRLYEELMYMGHQYMCRTTRRFNISARYISKGAIPESIKDVLEDVREMLLDIKAVVNNI
jgi:hypothetical protein